MELMLRQALRETRGLRDQFENCLLGEDGEMWKREAKNFLAKRPCWTKKFIVRAKFVVNIEPNALVKIRAIGDNFQNWFLDLVEDQVSKLSLAPLTLDRAMYDHEILAKLGGVAKASVSLGEMFSLMEKQPDGPKSEAEQLFVDGRSNIFYVPQPVKKLEGNRFSYVNRAGVEVKEKVKDSQYLFEIAGQWFVLRAVDVSWDGVGWYVCAFSVESPYGWDGGSRVFSRN